MHKLVVSAAASLLAMGIAAVPAAAETVSVSVKYADLNLASAQGVETLESRIAIAVKDVCAKPETIRDLKSMAAWESCKAEAAAMAREQVETTVQLASL